MKKNKPGILIASVALLIGFGCAYHTREDAIVPGATPTCDTSVKYTYASVDSLFINYECSSCHNNGGNLPNIEDLTTYRTYITANKDKFLNAINHIGANPMPKNAAKLPTKEINKIEAWICQGMK